MMNPVWRGRTTRPTSAITLFAVCTALGGCVAPVDDAPTDGKEAIGEASSAALGMNALGMNALGMNALGMNALGMNALGMNALGMNALGTSSLASLQDPSATGDLYRQLIKYTVGCALRPSQSFTFSWQDQSGVTHNESYPGALGFATSWASGPLDASGQRIISACLAARTNYFQVPVTISLRSSYDSIEDQTPDSELAAYPYVEGTFWGNLFASAPYLNTCYNAADVAHSRAAQRDCASGYPNGDGTVTPCGMIKIQGPCKDVCGAYLEQDGYYLRCVDQPDSGNNTRTKLVITTALP